MTSIRSMRTAAKRPVASDNDTGLADEALNAVHGGFCGFFLPTTTTTPAMGDLQIMKVQDKASPK